MVRKKPVYLTPDDWATVLVLLRKACTMEKAGAEVADRIESSLFSKRGG